MATKIYLPSSGSAPVTPSTWNFPNQINPLTFAGVLTPISSTLTTKLEATGTTSPTYRAMLRYVIGPLAGQSISGTVRGIMKSLESSVNANANMAIAVKLIQPNGSDRSVLLAYVASDSATSPYEINSSLNTRIFYTVTETEPLTLTTQTATAGDYLVIEIGFRSATGTTRNISLRYGDAGGSDFAYTNELTTDLNPWIEFSQTLSWLTNYKLNTTIGVFDWTRNNGILLRAYKIFTTIGAFVWTGMDAILTKGGGLTNYILQTTTGVFTWTRNNSILLRAYKIFTTIGAFVWTRSNSVITWLHKLFTTVGSFSWTRNNSILSWVHKLFTTTGTFSWTRNNAILLRAYKLFSTIGAFVWARNNGILLWGHKLFTTTGNYVWTRWDAILTRAGGLTNYVLQTITGTFTWTRNNGLLLQVHKLFTTIGAFGWTRNNGILAIGRWLKTTVGAFVWTGWDAILTFLGFVAQPGTVDITDSCPDSISLMDTISAEVVSIIDVVVSTTTIGDAPSTQVVTILDATDGSVLIGDEYAGQSV